MNAAFSVPSTPISSSLLESSNTPEESEECTAAQQTRLDGFALSSCAFLLEADEKLRESAAARDCAARLLKSMIVRPTTMNTAVAPRKDAVMDLATAKTFKAPNLYLVKSPRKNDPLRHLWRVKKQVSPMSFIRHFEFHDRDAAVRLAEYVNSLTDEEFRLLHPNLDDPDAHERNLMAAKRAAASKQPSDVVPEKRCRRKKDLGRDYYLEEENERPSGNDRKRARHSGKKNEVFVCQPPSIASRTCSLSTHVDLPFCAKGFDAAVACRAAAAATRHRAPSLDVLASRAGTPKNTPSSAAVESGAVAIGLGPSVKKNLFG